MFSADVTDRVDVRIIGNLCGQTCISTFSYLADNGTGPVNFTEVCNDWMADWQTAGTGFLAQFTGKVYLPLICTSTGFTGGIRKPSGKVLAIPYDVDSFPDDNNASGVTGMLMWGSIGMVEIEVGNYKSAGELNIDLHRIRTDGGYHKNYWLCGSGMVGVGTKIHQRLNPGDTVSREFTVKFTI